MASITDHRDIELREISPADKKVARAGLTHVD
jgi:hypothetical protein